MSPVLNAGRKYAAPKAKKADESPQPPAIKSVGKLKHGVRRVPGARKIVAKLLPGFSRQFSAMLSAGMPIVASLEALDSISAFSIL